MAQTIGYQRGKIAGIQANETAPSASIKDIFTNSGSVPMRVILAGFEVRGDTGGTFLLTQIGVKQNGSATDILCVQYKTTGQTGNHTTHTFYPSGSNGSGNQSANSAPTAGLPSRVDLVGSAPDKGMMNWSNTGQLLFIGPGNTAGVTNTTTGEVSPAFIWLMPGDVLCFRHYNSGGGNYTAIWSWVTIADTGS